MELMHVFVRVSGVFKNVKKVKGQLKLVQHIRELSQKKLGFNLTEKLYLTSSEIKSAVLCIAGVINKESSKFKKTVGVVVAAKRGL